MRYSFSKFLPGWFMRNMAQAAMAIQLVFFAGVAIAAFSPEAAARNEEAAAQQQPKKPPEKSPRYKGGRLRSIATQQQPKEPPEKSPEKPPAQSPKTPPDKTEPAKAEKAAPTAAAPAEEEYEVIERPTPFGVQRFKVPKKRSEAGGVAAPAGAIAAPAGAGAAPAGATPAQAAPQPTPAAPQQPAPPGAPAGTAPQTQPAPPAGGARISLHLENANLTQVIGIIAAELKMNYIVDPSVKGVVNINTLGELRSEDLLPLLQSILRANGATAVQSGSFWRIVPLKDAPRIPLALTRDPTGASLPTDDRMVMNVVALRFVTAGDMSKILSSYLSEAGHIVTHEQGNILLITDTSRSMKRLMELVSLFDTDTLAQQRIRVFPVQNSQARELVKDLKDIFAAYALSEKNTAVRFLPIERINSILVVTGNPSVYQEVQQWIEKLDKPVRRAGIQNFVYKVENGSAENLATVLSNLYGVGRAPARTPGFGTSTGLPAPGATGVSPGGLAPGAPGGPGLGGAAADVPSEISVVPGGILQSPVRIVPDLINNALIIQATAQDHEIIRQTLKELDIVPRQVLIEAKVYEVTLTGALAFGVEAFLQQRTNVDRKPVGQFSISGTKEFPNPGLSLSLGTLVDRTRQLLLFLNAQENRGRTRVISAPTILASDNTDARIQVGAEVPILTSQGVVAGAQAAGSSLFTNTVQQRDTGVILTVTPRINSSGLVTMRLQQEVSAPQPPPANAIQSPSIQKRSVSTQVTVQDGETIALGGIISESRVLSKSRVPLLGDIPGLGLLFGSTSYASTRTELIVLLTPRVIQDLDDAGDATQEFRSKLKELRKVIREKGE